MKRCVFLVLGAVLLPLALLGVILCAVSGVAAQTLTEGTPAAPLAVEAPAIVVTMTVGTNPAVCATTESVNLPVGGGVAFYCYLVVNTGDEALTRHNLVDSELGTILNAFPYTLNPGASAFLTQSASIMATTVSTATWTAYNPGPTDQVSASDSVQVNVAVAAPAIDLTMTVGTDPAICAATESVELPAGGGNVVYCYEVTNTGNVMLTRHDLVDSELGTILNAFPYTLNPGASAFLTQSAVIMATTASTATWTAFNPGPADVASAMDSATVFVGNHHYLPLLRRD
jgi:hypothetical protein